MTSVDGFRAEDAAMSEPQIERTSIGKVEIEVTRGDIARQSGLDAVVNAANAQLRIGGGVAGALHRAAGPGLEREAVPLGPLRPGEAVITSGHALPNPYVIHCLGPVYGRDQPSDRLLASCYGEALRIAEEEGLASVAFPALSTGAFGYPLEPAAEVALGTVLEEAQSLTSVQRLRFVLFGERAFQVHREVLGRLTAERSGSV